ncbi:transcriptional repressor NrdR [Candidatus Woesearchaeota archaeon]|nr:transcriptional repressor NrdR [Candidatus Woesearchaeota archaeon]
MKCAYCSFKETKVVDKRDSDGVGTIRRRRECLRCRKRFTTYERVETISLHVVKKDGRREIFDKEKIKRGIIRACEKRPVGMEQINAVVDKIESKMRNYKKNEVPTKVIGEEVMRQLKQLDKVAYIRFASVYRSFADIEEFKRELKEM